VKHPIIFAVVVFLGFGATVTAFTGTGTGATTMLDLATAGSSAELDVSVVSSTAVAPHEYALQNECYFSGNLSGPPQLQQEYEVVNWIYPSPPPYGGAAHALMTVDLYQVPAGATCRVFLVKGSTVVWGSTTEYKVVQQVGRLAQSSPVAYSPLSDDDRTESTTSSLPGNPLPPTGGK
jgi:hypothetical protein